MHLWQQLWKDNSGAILTAEAVMVGSVVVLGGMVGLSAASSAVNDEMTEIASAIRSMDQSYVIAGRSGCNAWTAGSYYIQPAVAKSVSELCGDHPADPAVIRESIEADRARLYPPAEVDETVAPDAVMTPEPAPENNLPPKKKTKGKKARSKDKDLDEQESSEAAIE